MTREEKGIGIDSSNADGPPSLNIAIVDAYRWTARANLQAGEGTVGPDDVVEHNSDCSVTEACSGSRGGIVVVYRVVCTWSKSSGQIPV